ncbi:hypothetical protein XELAEV_18011097mg [Xenopus laevis]|uniref:Uncharacterized protein n=1 Tax=Xenopus laevis TaxID=8355 RepID=A0A974DXY7_XENLA|nr:hypothetical protein XELAEV_18011097mg [Xenopus laevis]
MCHAFYLNVIPINKVVRHSCSNSIGRHIKQEVTCVLTNCSFSINSHRFVTVGSTHRFILFALNEHMILVPRYMVFYDRSSP